MKKLRITLVIVWVSSPFFAQGAFDKFDGQENITSIVVNKKMFELMSKVKVDASDKETQQYLSLIKKLDNLKVFTTKSTRVEGEMKVAAEKYIKTAALEELMRVNENGRTIKIMVKSGAKDTQIRELLMFIEGIIIFVKPPILNWVPNAANPFETTSPAWFPSPAITLAVT